MEPWTPGRLAHLSHTTLFAFVVCAALAACGGPETLIASGVLTAAMRTAIDEAEKNRPTTEQRWQEAKIAHLERRALAGDAEAQFQIGRHYLVLREPAAQQWICAAANGGHAGAQLQYGHWFNEDRRHEDLFPFIGITPDNAVAYMWYDLAASNGEPRATHFRDALIYAGMPATQLERGRARVASWTPQPCAGARITAASSDTATGR